MLEDRKRGTLLRQIIGDEHPIDVYHKILSEWYPGARNEGNSKPYSRLDVTNLVANLGQLPFSQKIAAGAQSKISQVA
jgi:hypothetical protein